MGRTLFLFLHSLGIIHQLTAVLVKQWGASLRSKPWQSSGHPIWLCYICALVVPLLCNPCASTHSLLTFIYSFVFSLACSHRCHFHVMKGGWGCVDTTLGLTSMLRWQMGKALCTSKKRGHSRTFSLWIEALLGDVSRRGDFCSMRKAGINILPYFHKARLQFAWLERDKNTAVFSRNKPNALILP